MKFAARNIIIASIVGLSLLYTYNSYNSIRNHLQSFCEWVDSLGNIGFIVLGIADFIGVAICFPFTITFELAAGFLYRFYYGTLLIITAKTCGAALAFFLGRTFLRDWIERKLDESPRFSTVYKEMDTDTFKLAVLLRLSPIPSWVNNYGLALTPITFKEFCTATFAAGIPFAAQNVYIGSLMNSLTMENTDVEDQSWLKKLSLSIPLIATDRKSVV